MRRVLGGLPAKGRHGRKGRKGGKGGGLGHEEFPQDTLTPPGGVSMLPQLPLLAEPLNLP